MLAQRRGGRFDIPRFRLPGAPNPQVDWWENLGRARGLLARPPPNSASASLKPSKSMGGEFGSEPMICCSADSRFVGPLGATSAGGSDIKLVSATFFATDHQRSSRAKLPMLTRSDFGSSRSMLTSASDAILNRVALPAGADIKPLLSSKITQCRTGSGGELESGEIISSSLPG